MEQIEKVLTGRSKHILESLQKGRLSFDEFQRDCALWLLEPEVWETFIPIPLPERTPAVFDYEMEKRNAEGMGKRFKSGEYINDLPEKEAQEVKGFLNGLIFCYWTNKERMGDCRYFKRYTPDAAQLWEAKEREFKTMMIRAGAELGYKQYLSGREEMSDETKKIKEEIESL